MTVRVTFLGAGDAFHAGARCHASYLVQAPGTRVLLDCGATAVLALKRAGFDINDLDAIFISHLHGDHFAGIPFLFLTWTHESARRRPVTIAGPPGTEERVHSLYAALYRDLAAKPMPFEVEFVELEPGVRRELVGVGLLPFRVPHQETGVSLGLRVSAAGKTVLYSGDTGWTEDLVVQSQATDLFICECCFFETRVDFHLDYPRIAENRHRFGCRRLVLTHIGREVLARRGEVALEIAEDGLIVDL